MAHTPDEIVLRFRPEGQGPPCVVRVRSLLKSALRSHRLRCVAVESLPTVDRVAAEASGQIVDRVMRVRTQLDPHRDGPFARHVNEVLRECHDVESHARSLLHLIVEHESARAG